MRDDTYQRGLELYELEIKPRLTLADDGKIIAIDVDTGEFVLADEILQATHALMAKNHQARLFGTRVGEPGIARLGIRRSEP